MMRTSKLHMNLNLAYIIIYLLPVAGGLFFLIAEFEDRSLRLHALQALYVGLCVLILHILLGWLALIPFIGVFFTVLIWIMYVVYALAMLIGLARAINGSIIRLPGFYNLAEKGCR